MKALVVFFSHNGNTRLVAEIVANVLGADQEELKPEKPLNASGAGYVMWGLRQLVSESKPALRPLEHDPRAYDLIVIGTPVWSYTLSPPVRTFLESVDFSGKKVALFCCHGGSPRDTLKHMQTAFPHSQVIGTADFFEPAKRETDTNRQKAQEWAQTLKNA